MTLIDIRGALGDDHVASRVAREVDGRGKNELLSFHGGNRRRGVRGESLKRKPEEHHGEQP
jgi:hypothetical protein